MLDITFPSFHCTYFTGKSSPERKIPITHHLPSEDKIFFSVCKCKSPRFKIKQKPVLPWVTYTSEFYINDSMYSVTKPAFGANVFLQDLIYTRSFSNF